MQREKPLQENTIYIEKQLMLEIAETARIKNLAKYQPKKRGLHHHHS